MTVSFQSPKDAYYFFGYFDKSPFDAGDEKLLAQRVSFMDRMPGANDALEVGYFDWRRSDRFVKIAESRAWNWQTGCMAQWLGPDCDTEIIYSDRDEQGACTVRLNIATGEKRRYPAAVGGVDPAGRYALSVDYEHMHGMREGYGFAAPGDTGATPGDELAIRRLDLDSGEVELVVGLPDVKGHRPLPSMSTADHMLDNPLFNPAGDRFAFFHRWQLPDGAFYTRLYTADVDGGDLRLLHDTGRVSHINWRDDRELVAFLGWERRSGTEAACAGLSSARGSQFAGQQEDTWRRLCAARRQARQCPETRFRGARPRWPSELRAGQAGLDADRYVSRLAAAGAAAAVLRFRRRSARSGYGAFGETTRRHGAALRPAPALVPRRPVRVYRSHGGWAPRHAGLRCFVRCRSTFNVTSCLIQQTFIRERPYMLYFEMRTTILRR